MGEHEFGMVRRKITPKPWGSTLQPMMPSVSGQICSPTCSIWVAPPSPARNTTAAAPSPNRLTATMLALVSSSCRSASEHSSRVTTSTFVPGRACARRAAIDNPDVTAGAAETEHRHPHHVGPKPHPPRNPRLQARRCNSRRADRYDGVDITCSELRIRQRLFGHINEQRLCTLQERRRPLRPSAWFEIPLERFDAMTLDDSGIGKNSGEPLELRKAVFKHAPCGGQNVLLQEDVCRHRRRQRDQVSFRCQRSLLSIRLRRNH